MHAPPRPVSPRPVQALLFRQTLLLAAVLGAASFVYPSAVALALLLPFLDRRCGLKTWPQVARLLMLMLCVAVGFAWAWWRAPVAEPFGEPVRGMISGRVLEVAGLYDRRLRLTLDDVRVQPESGRAVTLSGRTTWTLEGFREAVRPVPGQTVQFSGKVSPVTGFRNDGADGAQRWWSRQGIFWRVWSGPDTAVQISGTAWHGAALREGLRQRLMAQLQHLYPDTYRSVGYGEANTPAPRGSGFVPALLFGDRFYIGVEDWNRLSHAGLVHSIALSGQHLAVTGLLAALVLWLTGRVWPEAFLRRPRTTLGLWLCLPLAGLYLWLGNAPNSLIRSALMLGCLAVISTVRRPATLMDGLVYALGLMVLADPDIVSDVGAQLSFLAVFGLVLASPLLQRWRLLAARRPWLLAGGGVLICSAIIQISTLPVTLATFGWISPWWWLNLLWLPVLGVWVLPLCVLALLAVAAGIEPLSQAALVLAVEPCGLLLEGLRVLAEHLEPLWCLRPCWTSSVGLLMLLAGTALLWERPGISKASRRLCVLGFVLLLSGPFVRLFEGLSPEIRLRLLDVGQGQAALLEFPGERRVLVDGGGVRSVRFDTGRHLIGPALTRNRPPRLDALILSHPDMDHLRGLLFLAENFVVGEAVLPVGVLGHDTARGLFADYLRTVRKAGIPVREVRAGASLLSIPHRSGTVTLDVLAPLPGRELADNDGLVLRLRRDGQGLVILPGDATRSLLGALAREGGALHTDILVAPHHGSRQNMRDDFLRAVAAREIWVSCGAHNRYGFPSPELRDFCTTQGIVLRQTAEEGEIRFSWTLNLPEDTLISDESSLSVAPFGF